jgi:hypothetical protein
VQRDGAEGIAFGAGLTEGGRAAHAPSRADDLRALAEELAVGGRSEAVWMWSFAVPVPAGRKAATAWLWVPPTDMRLRGVVVAQRTLLELPLLEDPRIRAACARQGLAILLFQPGFDAIFNWVERDALGILDRTLAEAAIRSGCPELATVPVVALGHSVGGHFARNIGYGRPERCLGVVHLKSGQIAPPAFAATASLMGVPFLAVNGQHEEFGPGPSGVLRSNETSAAQWQAVATTITGSDAAGDHAGLVIDPGAGHFGHSPLLSVLVAAWLEEVAALRLGATQLQPLRPGAGVRTALGWLPGPRTAAIAAAAAQRGRGEEQFLYWPTASKRTINDARPQISVQPDATGRFTISAAWLDTHPTHSASAGAAAAHSATPIRYRVLRGALVADGPSESGRFRIIWDRFGIDGDSARCIVLAEHPGDERFRPTERAVEIRLPLPKGRGATPRFTSLPESLPPGGAAVAAVDAAGAAVPVLVQSGPAELRDGVLYPVAVPACAPRPLTIVLLAQSSSDGVASATATVLMP